MIAYSEGRESVLNNRNTVFGEAQKRLVTSGTSPLANLLFTQLGQPDGIGDACVYYYGHMDASYFLGGMTEIVMTKIKKKIKHYVA